jgi:hypothetical protein
MTVTPNEYPQTFTTVTISVHPSPLSPSFASHPKRQKSDALTVSVLASKGMVMEKHTGYRRLKPLLQAAKKARHSASPALERVS